MGWQLIHCAIFLFATDHSMRSTAIQTTTEIGPTTTWLTSTAMTSRALAPRPQPPAPQLQSSSPTLMPASRISALASSPCYSSARSSGFRVQPQKILFACAQRTPSLHFAISARLHCDRISIRQMTSRQSARAKLTLFATMRLWRPTLRRSMVWVGHRRLVASALSMPSRPLRRCWRACDLRVHRLPLRPRSRRPLHRAQACDGCGFRRVRIWLATAQSVVFVRFCGCACGVTQKQFFMYEKSTINIRLLRFTG